ncbi:DUF159-domain-containing protein [Aspergillus campestris IBT 28561]|uniref:DUF159-domain-containing protein n=1 Tax=Aspergillus campestris (strain IBT 28561) TaxID=1392248 RepID=A0A2I1DC35_ASPC2|nr:DUF159-domain-containing protein [Aspergillus campestris IBT 28561]PKY07452.1 DUF159-domain-containing protein [Aspergillus campestris IBT 28561]
MCGRYALGVRMAYVRNRMQQQGLPVDQAPDDDDVRETFNFAPGNNGAVYCAQLPSPAPSDNAREPAEHEPEQHETEQNAEKDSPTYKIQSMKWGLVPFWTKRKPDYGSLMRTINCRDDSLSEDRGMWTSMKRTKRCVVICQGFYEWLKKGPGGREKVPYFVKRKDGDLMYFAGLWDKVTYEGSNESLYSYTVITTSSNSELRFLHDRMPVILDPNSEAMTTWLDPRRRTWSKELQAILKPYDGELEYYPVSKDVGKVGNNSPDFIVPVSSKENKSNIANFFANAKKPDPDPDPDPSGAVKSEGGAKKVADAPPVTPVKREHPSESESSPKKPKVEESSTIPSSEKKAEGTPGRKTRSATSAQQAKTGHSKPTDGSQRITSFFGK